MNAGMAQPAKACLVCAIQSWKEKCDEAVRLGFVSNATRLESINLIIGTEDKRGPAFLRSIAERTSALYSIMNEKGIDPRPSPADFKSGKRDHLSGVSSCADEVAAGGVAADGQYWKHQAGGRYSFSLHEFVEQSWN